MDWTNGGILGAYAGYDQYLRDTGHPGGRLEFEAGTGRPRFIPTLPGTRTCAYCGGQRGSEKACPGCEAREVK